MLLNLIKFQKSLRNSTYEIAISSYLENVPLVQFRSAEVLVTSCRQHGFFYSFNFGLFTATSIERVILQCSQYILLLVS